MWSGRAGHELPTQLAELRMGKRGRARGRRRPLTVADARSWGYLRLGGLPERVSGREDTRVRAASIRIHRFERLGQEAIFHVALDETILVKLHVTDGDVRLVPPLQPAVERAIRLAAREWAVAHPAELPLWLRRVPEWRGVD